MRLHLANGKVGDAPFIFSALLKALRSAADSTIGPRIYIRHFDGKNGRCGCFAACRPCKIRFEWRGHLDEVFVKINGKLSAAAASQRHAAIGVTMSMSRDTRILLANLPVL